MHDNDMRGDKITVGRGVKTETIESKIENAKWGVWGTLIWGSGIVLAVVAGQLFIFGLYVGGNYNHYLGKDSQKYDASDIEQLAIILQEKIQFDGNVVSLQILTAFLVSGLLIAIAIKIKKGAVFSDYLAIKLTNSRTIELGVFIVFGYLVLANVAALLLGQSVPPKFMQKIYDSAEHKWMLWTAVVIAAPIFEEVFMRGFLYAGLENTPYAPYVPISVTALIWAVMYSSLGWFVFINTVIVGLMLGYARYYSGSLLLVIGLHMLLNFMIFLMTANQFS